MNKNDKKVITVYAHCKKLLASYIFRRRHNLNSKYLWMDLEMWVSGG